MVFVAVALGWAVYLLPMALKRNDELDRSRPVEEFSESVRVLGRSVVAKTSKPSAPAETASAPAPVLTITREAAKKAARRRRRVLALLLTTLVAVSVTSYLSYTPWFSTAIPGGLIVAFLVVARLTVRAQQVRLPAPVQQYDEHVAPAAGTAPAEILEAELDVEDTVGVSREALEAAISGELAEPVLDEGGLWDPLPVTLPTYVNKARARRTVRTIEITAASTGITSSGHDAADSALAAEAREAAAEVVEVEVDDAKAAGA